MNAHDAKWRLSAAGAAARELERTVTAMPTTRRQARRLLLSGYPRGPVAKAESNVLRVIFWLMFLSALWKVVMS